MVEVVVVLIVGEQHSVDPAQVGRADRGAIRRLGVGAAFESGGGDGADGQGGHDQYGGLSLELQP